jgi:hypothetical protein
LNKRRTDSLRCAGVVVFLNQNGNDPLPIFERSINGYE